MTPNSSPEDRVRGGHSMHDAENPTLCPDKRHEHWRVVRCRNDRDIVECSRCGKQRDVPCNFDEDYS